MNRRLLRLRLGVALLEILPDGRVLVTLPATALPFGCAMQATVVYRNLREALRGTRKRP